MMSNGRRKYVRIDDSAVTSIKMDDVENKEFYNSRAGENQPRSVMWT